MEPVHDSVRNFKKTEPKALTDSLDVKNFFALHELRIQWTSEINK